MPRTPSADAKAAQDALGASLRELMHRAGLTGVALAHQANWHASKSSRLVNGRTMPSSADIIAWCRICDAEDRIEDLLAQTRSVNSMYVEWRKRERTGLRQLQDSYRAEFERTSRFRLYGSDVIPGFLQTQAYAAELLAAIARFRGVPDDSEAAAAARVERSTIIRRRGRTFAFLIEEAVLRYRVGDVATMTGQLEHLLAVMRLPAVSVGVIPSTADRRSMLPLESFSIHDDGPASAELLTAEITITAPGEVRDYAKAFSALMAIAAHGQAARDLIARAIDELG
ncbi:helix-turn-helix domain-containing protein [Yinghuangia sp. YIM S09857]|uniref:helix-turn-helix domain-containing protein n=1 Tax=Yinghuangia sp. YIM S09857 TaxID=3436929 RepID=UPI003F53C8D2